MNGSLHLLSESDEFHIITVRRYEGLGAHPPLHLLGDLQQLCIVFIRCEERLREWLGDFKERYRYFSSNLSKDYVDVNRCVVRLRITNIFEVVEDYRMSEIL